MGINPKLLDGSTSGAHMAAATEAKGCLGGFGDGSVAFFATTLAFDQMPDAHSCCGRAGRPALGQEIAPKIAGSPGPTASLD
jgi:hypothetical protein